MKAKKTMTVMLLSILSACLVCGLSACGGTTAEPVSKEQISTDVQARDTYLAEYNLDVKSFSVSQRQTNTEDKIDSVRCRLTATNGEISYSAEYTVTYVLFKDEWTFENFSKETSSVTPLYSPTEADAEAWIREDMRSKNVAVYEIIIHKAIVSDAGTDIDYPFGVLKEGKGIGSASGELARCGILSYHFDPYSG